MNTNIELLRGGVKSEVKKFTFGFTWEIKDICVLMKEKAWETATCEIDIKGTTWNFSLSSCDDNHLSCFIALASPPRAKLQYNVKFSIMNNLGRIGYTQNGTNKFIITTKSEPQKWEILRMNANFVNPIEGLMFNNMLKLCIEMTITGESGLFN